MKSIEDFVNTDYFNRKYGTLQENIQNYKKLSKDIELLNERKKKYEDLINSDDVDSSNELTFKERYTIYKLIKEARLKSNNNIDDSEFLYLLQLKYEDLFDDLKDYLTILDGLKAAENLRIKLITEHITFDLFDKECFSEHCLEGHSFVVDDKALKCVYCGFSTKDYPLTDEQFEFLVMCADKRNILLSEFNKEDWPFIQVIVERQNYNRSLRPEIDMDADDYLDQIEEQYYDNEQEFTDMRLELARAHMLDNQIYESKSVKVNSPKYLTKAQKNKLLKQLDKEIEEIKKANSKYKPLLLEQCKTAKYEILILSGEHIPTMVKNITDEDELVSLTKAYYNLSNTNFRINSGYFKAELLDHDAICYDCYTANPVINQKILDMKMKRHN